MDVVVLTKDKPKYIKERLLETNSRFYLKDGINGPYTVLWYSFSWKPRVHCKVDILVPPELRIPNIILSSIAYCGDSLIPVMPFLPLLILKVQGWSDHRKSHEERFQVKVPQDEEDITDLLSMLDSRDHLKRFGWLPRWFLRNANDLIQEYVECFPETESEWRYIGFDV